MGRDDEELRRTIEELREEIDRIEHRLHAVETELDRRERRSSSDDESSSTDTSPEERPDQQATPQSERSDDTPAEPPPSDDDPTTAWSDEHANADDAVSAEDERDLELALGRRWLGIVGGLALVIGVVFLIQEAVQRGWIGPVAQLALGWLAGIGLATGGRLAATRRGYDRWGMAVLGTGIAVTYTVTYAAASVETYREATSLSVTSGTLLLSVVVGVAVVLAVRDETRTVAGEAFGLGYLTAWLGTDIGVFDGYVIGATILLGAGIAVTVSVRRWRWLPVGAVVPSYLLYVQWTDAANPAPAIDGLAITALFAVLGTAAFLSMAAGSWRPLAGLLDVEGDEARTAGPRQRGPEKTSDWPDGWLPPATTLTNTLLFAWLGTSVANAIHPSADVLLYLSLSGLAFGYDALTRRSLDWCDPTVPSLAVLFLVVAPITATAGFGLTATLAAITVSLTVVSVRIGDSYYWLHSHVLVACTLVALTVNLGELPSVDPTTLPVPAKLYAAAVVSATSAVLAFDYYDRERLPVPASLESSARDPAALSRTLWLGHAWLALVVLATGLAADIGRSFWVTIVGSALVLALFVLARRADAPVVKLSADLGLAGLVLKAFVDLGTLQSFDPTVPLVESGTVAALAVIALCYVGAHRFDEPSTLIDEALDRRSTPVASQWFGTGLLLALLGFELSGGRISAAWALLGLALLGLGVRLSHRQLRLQAMGTLGLTTVKVFLIDTSGLDTLARTVSFLVLGTILLAASYLYARYGDRLVGSKQPNETDGKEQSGENSVETDDDGS